MSSHLPVLIVGAGPTGLMMACELARFHIPFRIIDKNPQPTSASNATWIQTGSLELFDHVGIVNQFLKRGHRCDAINLYSHGKALVQIPFAHLDSSYPYVLMMPQSETEKLLTEHLEKSKHKVDRSLELIDVKQQDNQVISTIRHANGKTETITSDWLIACDGVNSSIRQKFSIDFPGVELSEQFMVADAEMNSFQPRNEINVFFDKETIFAAFPLGDNKYRIFANLHQSHPRKIFIEKEVKEIVDERARGEFHVNSISWISPFWTHSRIVDNMRHGSIFFAGDAAHIHAAVGGQGMNTGLQDAYNLIWKIALVHNGKAQPSLLDSYQAERHPVISKIVNQTERFTKMAVSNDQFLMKLRDFGYRLSHSEKQTSKKFSMEITQLNTDYRESPAIDYQEKITTKSPRQGMRAPDVVMNESKRLYDYLRGTTHHVLLFTGVGENCDLSLVEPMQQWLQKYVDLIHSQIVSSVKLDKKSNIIFDTDAIIHKRYNIKYPVIYIIRPDNIIAFCSKDLNIESVEKFLKTYLFV